MRLIHGFGRLLGVALLAATLSACDEDSGDEITVSGTIDADTIAITSEYGGQVSDIFVADGDSVEEGDELLRLDAALIDAQIDEASALVDAARAQLDEVTDDPRQAELDAAQAAVDQAVAEWGGARTALEYAKEAADDPRAIDAQLLDAGAQVSRAAVQLAYAQSALGLANDRVDNAETAEEREIAASQVEAAEAMLEQARTGLAGAEKAQADLRKIREEPQDAVAQVNRAESAHKLAEARVEAAEAALDLLEAGPTDSEVAAAEANVRQAEAALESLQLQREQMSLLAPGDGLVVDRSVEVGELAQPGAVLMQITDLGEVQLVVFVPESDIGGVDIGQSVDVEVDAYPDDVFEGAVTSIAEQAEFTPRNVQTEEQRVNLVFAVTITLDNPDQQLRPGMPAEAILELD
jgi:multidrug resistance efflux pump